MVCCLRTAPSTSLGSVWKRSLLLVLLLGCLNGHACLPVLRDGNVQVSCPPLETSCRCSCSGLPIEELFSHPEDPWYFTRDNVGWWRQCTITPADQQDQ